MATKNSKPITYSTAENFNPLEDYNVSVQYPTNFGGKYYETEIWPADNYSWRNTKGAPPPLNTHDLNQIQRAINEHASKAAPDFFGGKPTARYETEASARSAAPYNAGISKENTKNDGKFISGNFGYVPKAEKVADATSENYLNSPTVQKTLQRSRESVAKMEAANTPADMAAYRAKTYQKEADRKAAAGDPQSAARWKKSADQEAAKARQLGYKGDISKATIKNPERTAQPKAPTATAGAPKPAPAATSATPSSSESLEDYDRKNKYREVKGHMDDMEARDNRISDMKGQFETNDKIKDLKGELAYDRKAEQNWKDKAAKATDPARKEHALQMAGEYADKARKREAEIAELEKGSKVEIPKISDADKKGKTPQSATDPMEKLIADIPTMNNSSAYNTGGAGAGSGVAGFFTRDGKVIPITA